MHVGPRRWTWYTGSAGWMYQAAVQALLGLRRWEPTSASTRAFPRSGRSTRWSGRSDVHAYRFVVTNPDRRTHGVALAQLDGADIDPKRDSLVDDGAEHEVSVVLESGCPPGRHRRRRTTCGQSHGPENAALVVECRASSNAAARNAPFLCELCRPRPPWHNSERPAAPAAHPASLQSDERRRPSRLRSDRPMFRVSGEHKGVAMGPLGELLAVSERRALEFFATGLKDVCEPDGTGRSWSTTPASGALRPRLPQSTSGWPAPTTLATSSTSSCRNAEGPCGSVRDGRSGCAVPAHDRLLRNADAGPSQHPLVCSLRCGVLRARAEASPRQARPVPWRACT
jgi:hypothetical protein